MTVLDSLRTTGRLRAGWLAAAVLALWSALASSVSARDAACARVRIEIKQELTLERQAFEAEMQITHALDTRPMTEIAINVVFSDENGNPVRTTGNPNDSSWQAAFFERTDGLEGIQNVAGGRTVEPGASAKIRWLITLHHWLRPQRDGGTSAGWNLMVLPGSLNSWMGYSQGAGRMVETLIRFSVPGGLAAGALQGANWGLEREAWKGDCGC